MRLNIFLTSLLEGAVFIAFIASFTILFIMLTV